MCTVVLLRRPDHPWPVVLGANRDEMADRPWLPPGRHWPDRPNVVGGQDRLAAGSWMGINDEGVVALILNRLGTLGPEPGKRTRGELVLEALDHADAVEAAEALRHLDPTAYRPFNMLIADNRDAFWLRADGKSLRLYPVGEGTFMMTAFDMNDPADPRVRHFLPLFNRAPPPLPDSGEWAPWRDLLARPAPPAPDARPQDGLAFQLDTGFGTRNASLLALPSVDRPEISPVWLFAPDAPNRAHFRPVAL